MLIKVLTKTSNVETFNTKSSKASSWVDSARMSLASLHEHISNQRKDFQWKLAHDICRRYDYIFIEDLCLAGMTRLWGRKVNDFAYAQFVSILEQVAMKYGCVVHKIDRWYASSKMCDCGYKNAKLTLRDRTWVCPVCGRVHDRDIHAAENILRRGIYELSSGSETNEATAERLPAKAS